MHRLRLPGLWCAVTLLLAGGAWPARATLVTYDSFAAWQAATSSYQTIDFEVTTSATSYSTASGYSPNSNIQFIGQSSPGNFLWVVDTVANPGNSYDTGDVLKGPAYDYLNKPNRRIDVNLNPGVTAFSLNLMTYLSGSSTAPPQDFKIQLSTGDVITPIHTATQPTTTFFGVTSTEPITLAQIFLITGTFDTYPLIDNVSYGTAAPPVVIDPPPGETSETPEPVTYLLVGTGLIGLSLASKRCRQSKG